VIISISNVWARVVDAAPDERAWVFDFFSCNVEQWFAAGGYMDTITRSMVDQVSGRFASGLVPLLIAGLRRSGITAEIQDDRVVPSALDSTANLAWLRTYQRSAVDSVQVRRPRGMIKAPTGAGKSEIFIGLTRALPCEWLFVVHRASILDEVAKRYALRTGEQAGVFSSGRWRKGTCNVTLASFQTLHRGLKRGDAITRDFLCAMQGVNVDECHAQSAASFYAVLQSMPNAYYRVGQSGTPLVRDDWDNLRTIGALGPVIYQIPRQVLVDGQVLSAARVRMVECSQPDYHTPYWREIYQRSVVYSAKRNCLLAEIAARARKPAFLFIDEINHGEQVHMRLKRRGVRVSAVYGDKQAHQRASALQDLVDGRTEVLICTAVFQEGVDVPALKAVINGQGKKSIIAQLQRIGRGMRVCGDGDNTFDVWDIADTGQHVLERHAKKRLATYQDEGYEVESCPFEALAE